MSNTYENFKSTATGILDFSFFTFLVLIVIGGAFYMTVLPTNVQNVLPLIVLLLLTVFTWIIRVKIAKSTIEQYVEIRQILIQGLSISAIVTIFSVILIIIYPVSS